MFFYFRCSHAALLRLWSLCHRRQSSVCFTFHTTTDQGENNRQRGEGEYYSDRKKRERGRIKRKMGREEEGERGSCMIQFHLCGCASVSEQTKWGPTYKNNAPSKITHGSFDTCFHMLFNQMSFDWSSFKGPYHFLCSSSETCVLTNTLFSILGSIRGISNIRTAQWKIL